jgi:ABC-2 type transport system permease protein
MWSSAAMSALARPRPTASATSRPLAWALVGRLAGLETVVHWLDPTSSLAPMTEHLMDATEWAHAGTTLALRMVLPLVVGLWRIQRGEIR